MSPSRKHTVAVITACIAFVIFGFSFMFSSIALSIAPTTVLLCFRFTAAVLTLSLVVAANALVGRIRGKAWFSFSLRGKPLGGVLLLGLVQPVLYLVFENSSIRYTSSAVTGTVLAVVPVICILADVFISHESVTKLQILCAVACVGGVALVETGGETRISLLGFVCLLMTLVCDVGYYVLSRRASPAVQPPGGHLCHVPHGHGSLCPGGTDPGARADGRAIPSGYTVSSLLGQCVFLGCSVLRGRLRLAELRQRHPHQFRGIPHREYRHGGIGTGRCAAAEGSLHTSAGGSVVVILVFVTLANLPKKQK